MADPNPPSLHAPSLGWQLFESSPDCLKLLDCAGRVQAMNANGVQTLEIEDFAAVAGTPWTALWPAAARADIEAAVAAARAGGTGHFVGFCPTAKGTPKWWDVRVVPVADPQGGGNALLAVSRDITATRQAERELRAANERMAEIFRQAPAVICVLRGPEHVVELVNDRYLHLVGGRDPAGQPIRAALPEIEGQGYFELLDSVYRTGKPFIGTDMPVKLQRRAGQPLEERFIDLVYMALRDADGNVTGILAHAVDVTPRKVAENALHESRERFEKIVSQAATGVVEMDVAGRITFVNRTYRDMLGYADGELIGLSAVDVTAPAALQSTLDALARLLATGTGFVIDKHYVRKDGSLMPATSAVNALRGQDGAIHGMVAIVLDTTERERTARELQASEERYRTLFESMDQGFCIIEMIQDEDGEYFDYRFLEMNPMFEEHTGIRGAVGRTVRELVPGLDDFWVRTYGRVARTGQPVRFENEAAAMRRWFDVYATPSGEPGSGRVALLFTDITARKAADEHLRRLAADLSEADRRKTEFLATLAHELRNPLAPIRSGLGVMRLSGDSGPAVTKVREMMERQVEHMVHLIDDLLDVARISGGKLVLKKSRADLRHVLASAVETSLPAIEAAHHQFVVDVADVPLQAEVDVIRIAQVVANLLNNAAKYTPPGGRIRLSAARDGGMAVITVADSGVGIPAESIGKLFEMFSQIGRNLDLAQGGLGIGLSLVRRLVEMHGGRVTATSGGIGAGSEFTVRLPLLDGANDARSAAAPSETPAATVAGLDVLVVDDNGDAAGTLAMVLELDGHAVRVAHSGVEAMELLADAAGFTPHVAFLDIGMPGMNGYETARAIRKLPRLAATRLVALTGWGTDSDRERSREAGFDRHLTKPVQVAEVRAILAGLADAE